MFARARKLAIVFDMNNTGVGEIERERETGTVVYGGYGVERYRSAVAIVGFGGKRVQTIAKVIEKSFSNKQHLPI